MAEYTRDPFEHYQHTFAAKISTRSPNDVSAWRSYLLKPEQEGVFSIMGWSRGIVDGAAIWTYEVRCSHWLTLFAFGAWLGRRE